MSKGVNIQFHARDTECAQLVTECCQELKVKLLLVQYFPTLKVREVVEYEDLLRLLNSLGNCGHRVFIFSLYNFNLDAKKSSELNQKNPHTLSLTLGRETDDLIDESWLCTNYHLNDEESSKIWQKISRKLKKITKTGAWLIRKDTGGRRFVKGHRYTEGARLAQAEGYEMITDTGKFIYDFNSPKPE